MIKQAASPEVQKVALLPDREAMRLITQINNLRMARRRRRRLLRPVEERWESLMRGNLLLGSKRLSRLLDLEKTLNPRHPPLKMDNNRLSRVQRVAAKERQCRRRSLRSRLLVEAPALLSPLRAWRQN
jgi:hypothetical protein